MSKWTQHKILSGRWNRKHVESEALLHENAWTCWYPPTVLKQLRNNINSTEQISLALCTLLVPIMFKHYQRFIKQWPQSVFLGALRMSNSHISKLDPKQTQPWRFHVCWRDRLEAQHRAWHDVRCFFLWWSMCFCISTFRFFVFF